MGVKQNFIPNEELEQEQNFQVINQQIKRNQNSLNSLEDYMFSNKEIIPVIANKIENQLIEYQENISTDEKTYKEWLKEMQEEVKKIKDAEKTTEQQSTEQQSTEQQSTEQQSTEQQSTEQQSTEQHCTEQQSTEQHYTEQQSAEQPKISSVV